MPEVANAAGSRFGPPQLAVVLLLAGGTACTSKNAASPSEAGTGEAGIDDAIPGDGSGADPRTHAVDVSILVLDVHDATTFATGELVRLHGRAVRGVPDGFPQVVICESADAPGVLLGGGS